MPDSELLSWLVEASSVEQGEGEYRGLHDLVAREGEPYRPVEVPTDLRRRRAKAPHRCFQRSYAVAMDSDWTYVEGFVQDAGELAFTVHHAWLTKYGAEAIDLALPFDPDREYIGVAIETVSLAKAASRTGIVGSFLGDGDLHRHGFGPSTLTPARPCD